MDIKLDIKPEDIEKYVGEAVINSSLGESVKNIIEEQLNGWDFKRAIEEEVRKCVLGMVREALNDEAMKPKLIAMKGLIDESVFI